MYQCIFVFQRQRYDNDTETDDWQTTLNIKTNMTYWLVFMLSIWPVAVSSGNDDD